MSGAHYKGLTTRRGLSVDRADRGIYSTAFWRRRCRTPVGIETCNFLLSHATNAFKPLLGYDRIGY